MNNYPQNTIRYGAYIP
ncbi:hypothetical protein YPPY64_1464, partial [Yersinia pestis PY-64]